MKKYHGKKGQLVIKKLKFPDTVVIVGIGGIGSWLSNYIARRFNCIRPKWEGVLSLVDGDSKEEKNDTRQNLMGSAGFHKAVLKAQELQQLYPTLKIMSDIRYVTPDNVKEIVPENSMVLVCPDNHYCRRIILEHCATMDDVIVSFGGNTDFTGTAAITAMANNRWVGPNLLEVHDEIATAAPERSALSCEQAFEQGDTQTMASNLLAATLMMALIENLLSNGKIDPYEYYFDIKTGSVNTLSTRPKDCTKPELVVKF